MWNLEFVGHKLVEVFAVGLEDVLFERKTVDNGEDAVNTVKHKDDNKRGVAGLGDKFAKEKYNNEGYRDGADIPGKASGPPAEIEEIKHKQGNCNNIEEVIINKRMDVVVDPPERTHCNNAVATGNPVNTIHKIVGINNSGRDNKGYNKIVPGEGVEATIIKHQHHSHKMDNNSDPGGEVPHIVNKADDRYQG